MTVDSTLQGLGLTVSIFGSVLALALIVWGACWATSKALHGAYLKMQDSLSCTRSVILAFYIQHVRRGQRNRRVLRNYTIKEVDRLKVENLRMGERHRRFGLDLFDIIHGGHTEAETTRKLEELRKSYFEE